MKPAAWAAFAVAGLAGLAAKPPAEPDLVIVANGAEGHQGRQLGGELILAALHTAEITGGRDVHQQKHCELPFLDIFLDERLAHSRRDVPVDGPHVVAG